MKTKSILIVSLSSATRLNVPTIPLYKNQRQLNRIVVALSEPNFVFDAVFFIFHPILMFFTGIIGKIL